MDHYYFFEVKFYLIDLIFLISLFISPRKSLLFWRAIFVRNENHRQHSEDTVTILKRNNGLSFFITCIAPRFSSQTRRKTSLIQRHNFEHCFRESSCLLFRLDNLTGNRPIRIFRFSVTGNSKKNGTSAVPLFPPSPQSLLDHFSNLHNFAVAKKEVNTGTNLFASRQLAADYPCQDHF